MSRLKLRQFILFRGKGSLTKVESGRREPANGECATHTLHTEMETAGDRLKQALAAEHQLNRVLRRKSRFGAADLDDLREYRKAVEECAEVYVAAVRKWRTALQEEMSVKGSKARPAQAPGSGRLSGRTRGISFPLEVAPGFHK